MKLKDSASPPLNQKWYISKYPVLEGRPTVVNVSPTTVYLCSDIYIDSVGKSLTANKKEPGFFWV